MKKIKVFLSVLICIVLIISILPLEVFAVDTSTYANIVVFIDFADTTHNHDGMSWGTCYAEDPSETLRMFNGTSDDKRGFKLYFEEITYGVISINNIMPQYDGTKITALKLSHNTDYYCSTSVDMGTSDDRIMGEVISWLMSQNLGSYNLDGNNDGAVDNVTVIVPYEYGDKNTSVTAHKSSWPGTEQINGKVVRSYNIITEYGLYFGIQESGLLIHEYMHNFGVPDLYCRTGASPEPTPVGMWDIMASDSAYVQYPLAYIRSRYLNAFSIPTVTTDQNGYSIYSASSATNATKNNQAVILKTDYSNDEFFVIEYRQKGPTDAYSTEYDRKIYGSGLVIYRVDTSLETETNILGEPYFIYVFRDDNDIWKSFYSAESGRTSFSELTYSDGTNSGITISNIGSAAGNTISFDIKFNGPEAEYWKVEGTHSQTSTGAGYFKDSDGNQFFAMTTSDALKIYAYRKGIWVESASYSVNGATLPKIAKIGTKFFVSYLKTVNYQDYVNLVSFDGKNWNELLSEETQTYYALTSDDKNIYLGYLNVVNPASTALLSVKKYDNSTGILSSISDVSSTGYAKEPKLCMVNGDLYATYCSVFDGGKIKLCKYNVSSNTWTEDTSLDITARNAVINGNNGTLYLLRNGTDSTTAGSYLYKKTTNGWKQVGSNAVTEAPVNDSNIAFRGGNPIVTYQDATSGSQTIYVKYLKDGAWTTLGTIISSDDTTSIFTDSDNYNINVIYHSTKTNNVIVKAHEIPISSSLIPASELDENDCIDVEFTMKHGQTESRTMLQMINDLRTGSDAWYWNSDNTTKTVLTDLPELKYDYDLEKIAIKRAEEIVALFDHTRPNGSHWTSLYSELGFSVSTAGENIAAGRTTAQDEFDAWCETDKNYSGQGHRRNMLSDKFNAVGIAHVICGGRHYWVQEFGYVSNTSTQTEANDSEANESVKIKLNSDKEYVLLCDDITMNKSETIDCPKLTFRIYNTWVHVDGRIDANWESYDSSIVSVSDGKMTANGDGITTLTTTRLGETISFNVTVPHKHLLTKTEAKGATCTENGNIEYWTCSDCGKYFSDSEGKKQIAKDSWIRDSKHMLTKTEAKSPTCTKIGNTEYWTCGVCGKYFSDAEGKTEIAKDSWVVGITDHNLVKIEAKEATCTSAGNLTYWTCADCGKYFSDAEGKTEISKDYWIINVKEHELTKTDAVLETCTTAGNSEYWTCSTCGKHFNDAEGKTEINNNSWIIKATGHKLTKTEAKAATCTVSGNIAYWTCSECGKYFDDAEGTNEISIDSWVTKPDNVSHKLTKVEAKKATCTERGNTQYWACSDCDKYFSDAEGKTEIAKDSWVTKATGHNYNPETHLCVCGKFDPDFSGWLNVSGTWYYLINGVKQTGWIKDGAWYYLKSDGAMATGWVKDGSSWYYMKSSGAMATGWIKDGSNWYYMKSSGAMATGWVSDGGSWYYMKSSGAMATGWVSDGGSWYYMKSSGAMATGWVKDGSSWYYMKSSGAMATGWVKDGSTWYYMNSSGAMVTGTQRIDGKTYRFNSSGAWIA